VAQGVITGIRGLCNGLGPALYGFIFYLFHVDLDEHHAVSGEGGEGGEGGGGGGGTPSTADDRSALVNESESSSTEDFSVSISLPPHMLMSAYHREINFFNHLLHKAL